MNLRTFKFIALLLLTTSLLFLLSCDKNGDIVLFGISNDIQLGEQVAAEIAADPSYNILSETAYPEAYGYLNNMRDQILASDQISYRDEFVWKLHIIDEDVLNAFATPGGYIYVYTGLIKYLDQADDLAGVLGHEIAHADQRHSSKQLQQQYGISVLLSIALGQSGSQLAEIAGQIAGTGAVLAFSRSAESEADSFSVDYLADTPYACNGAASFFAKLIAEGQAGGTPQFLSTHPNPDNRVEAINSKATTLGCSTASISETGMTYTELKSSLPQ